MSILEVKNRLKKYTQHVLEVNQVQALSNVSFSVKKVNM